MNAIFRLLLLASRLPPKNVYRETALDMLDHMDLIGDKNIDQIAEVCHTNAATLSRLARKVNCRNFSEFRTEFNDALTSYPLINRAIPMQYTDSTDNPLVYIEFVQVMAESLREFITEDLLTCVCEKMHGASRIHLYASPHAPIFNSMLLHDLLLLGKKISYCNDWESIETDLEEVGPDSFVMLIPNLLFLEQSNILKIFARVIRVEAESVLVDSSTNVTTHFAPGQILKYRATVTASDSILNMFIINMLLIRHRKMYLEDT